MSSIATLLALLLMTAQCVRRFYETWFVSIFSDAKMNFSHYIVGFAHYFGAISAILVEAPGFTPHTGTTQCSTECSLPSFWCILPPLSLIAFTY